MTTRQHAPLRILFLDFDGVLNSGPYIRTWAQNFCLTDPEEANQSQADRFEMDAARIDVQAIQRVNRIVEATGAQVVVCSSWRHFHPVSRLRRLLRSRGFVGFCRRGHASHPWRGTGGRVRRVAGRPSARSMVVRRPR